MSKCHKCGTAWDGEGQPGFREVCPSCMTYLHCCHNCRFHDPKKHNECHIPNSEFVRDRFAANFCEEFEFTASGNAIQASRDRALQSFASLFGDSAYTDNSATEGDWDPKNHSDDAREAFNRLFKS